MREQIDELLNKEPFRPFRITLTSGQSYDVRYPRLIVVGKDVVHYMHHKSDLESILRLVQIAALDIIE